MGQTRQSSPLVSVIMATHNGERFIQTALRSVLSQILTDFEFIIIDDASTDATPQILASLSDSRVRVLTVRERLGLTRALNRALEVVRGRYIARIDDDDVWPDSTKLVRQIDFLDTHPRVGVVGTHNTVIDQYGTVLYRLVFPTTDQAIRQEILRRNVFPHSGVLIRRTALTAMGSYDETVVVAQDYELWLRLGTRWQLANIPDLWIQQRVHANRVSYRQPLAQWWSALRSAWRYRRHYPGFWRHVPAHFLNLVRLMGAGWRRRE